MKEHYERIRFEVIILDNNDVIVTSGDNGGSQEDAASHTLMLDDLNVGE